MKADLTRNTFDPWKHFTRVIMQQGRVQLDADWNEQAAILLRYLRCLAADLIGQHGGPQGNLGFQIKSEDSVTNDFSILPGHYYVDGILCELGGKVTYTTQPDYPAAPKLQTNSQIYLDVWERLVTYVEDDSIREVALGGADTAARSKLVCQVKQLSGGTCNSDLRSQLQPANRGLLIAQAKQTSTSTDPCVIAPNASYSGPENQLYRVEIHTGGAYGGATPPTFKWSRENGSVIFPIVNLTTGSGTTTVVLENLGRDDRFGLSEHDWVEIEDDDYVLLNCGALMNSPETLLQVQKIDSGSLTVTLTGTPPSNVGQTPSKHPLLRRWDQTCGDPAQGGLQMGSDNAALIVEGSSWLNLENGIQIQFQPAPGENQKNSYRTGDYWLIPARTATGDVEWPTGTSGPLVLPPDGVDHHYAPLAVIQVLENGTVSPKSCQQEFHQLAVPVKPET